MCSKSDRSDDSKSGSLASRIAIRRIGCGLPMSNKINSAGKEKFVLDIFFHTRVLFLDLGVR
jgi:hypothetical protein